MKIDKNRVNADQQDNYSFTETLSQMSSDPFNYFT